MHPFLERKFGSFLKNSARKDLRGSDTENEEDKFKGKDIKKLRKKYNLSQRCFAAMLDISVRTLQNYEIDRHAIPGTARSLFIFADDNTELFKKYYLKKIDNPAPYMDSMNRWI